MGGLKNPRDTPEDSDRPSKKPRPEKEIAPFPGFGSEAPSSTAGDFASGFPSAATDASFGSAPTRISSVCREGLSKQTGPSLLLAQFAAATRLPAISPGPLSGDGVTTGQSISGASTSPDTSLRFGTASVPSGMGNGQSGFGTATPNAQRDDSKSAETSSATTSCANVEQVKATTIKQEEKTSGTAGDAPGTQGVAGPVKQEVGSKTTGAKVLFNTQQNSVSGPIELLDARGNLILVAGAAQVNFRVCSRTLSRSSLCWERKLYGPFAPKIQEGVHRWMVRLLEDNPDALRIVLQAVHYNLEHIPAVLSRETLFHLTVLCEKYDMVVLLRPFWGGWVAKLPYPTLDPETFVQQVWITYKLGLLQSYKSILLEFLYSAQKRPDNDSRLFLEGHADVDLSKNVYLRKTSLMDTLERGRLGAIHRISALLKAAIDRLSSPTATSCTARYPNPDWEKPCDCAMLGGVIRALSRKPWYSSGRDNWEKLVTLSLRQLVTKMEGIRSFAIGESRMVKNQKNSHRHCTPWIRFELGDILGESNLGVDEASFRQRAEKAGLSASVASNKPVSAPVSLFA